MWIGLLFAIMCLATLYQQFSPNESIQSLYLQPAVDPNHLIRTYREKIIQCLVLGNYTKSVPYTIETLLLYLHVEYFRSEDTQVGTWILLGIIVRLALRMGYHRDASHFPRISPFHAEMRRRTWAIIIQLDTVASAQVGLPRMIREVHSDTREPRNLLDEDFDENVIDLPLPRPETVQTAIQYLVAKNKVISVFGMISDLTTSTGHSYAEVMRLDRLLDDTYKTISPGLHMQPMEKSIMDSPDIIMRRVWIALLFHKAKCILHRRYLLPARTEGRYTYSRTICIEAALHLLQFQSILDQETQAGGRLYQDRWKVSSLIKQKFLLATTILCLAVDHEITAESSSESQKYIPDTISSERVIEALNGSYLIWLQSSDSSKEAQKAAEVLRIVLGKAQSRTTRRSTSIFELPPEVTSYLISANESSRSVVFDGARPNFTTARRAGH